MKKYRYKYTPLTIVLIFVITAISIVTIILNVIKMVNTSLKDKYPSYILAILFAFAVILFAVSALFNAYYYIKNGKIMLKISFVNSGILISTISEVVCFTYSKRLSVYFENGQFSNVVISPERFDDFMEELKLNSKNLKFTVYDDSLDYPTN